jgi:hypothetical protein
MPRKNTQRPPPHRNAEAKRPGRGTPADRLIRAWLDADHGAFEALAEDLITGGRDGVLAAALRKLSEKYEAEAVEEFAAALIELAEVAEGRDAFDFAELVLLPVLAEGPPPDPAPLAGSLAGSGAFPPEAEVAFAEGWRSAEAVRSLSPCALRRVLLEVAGGRAPADLPPPPPGGMADGGVAVLVGALTFRTEPPRDDPDADLEALAAADEASEDERVDAFDRWRASLSPEATKGVLILPPCSPSDLVDEIEALLAGGGEDLEAMLDEISGFVETARDEAGGEEVVARLAAREGAVELTVLTRSGRELDSRVFDLRDDGPTVDDIRRVVGAGTPTEGAAE